MTATTNPLVRTVDEMLVDAGETDPRLRATLLSLGSLAALPVPEPRADLAALLSGHTHELGRHRLRRRHRSAAVGLAVIAGMGLGVTGVAATASSPGLNASPSVQHMMQDWAPSWTITGAPAAGGPASRVPDHTLDSGSQDIPVPAGQEREDQESGAPGPAAPEPATGSPSQEAGTGRGKADPGAASAGKAAADGAAGNAAGAAEGGPSVRDGATTDGQNRGQGAGTTDLLDNAGNLVSEAPAVVEALAPGLTAPGKNEKTGASDAGPGSVWLKKFSR